MPTLVQWTGAASISVRGLPPTWPRAPMPTASPAQQAAIHRTLQALGAPQPAARQAAG
ncbi:MAG: hypothetical protein AB7F22_14635 [Reyranella sp.]|uniref:hypothetical protein n=1 Tax=Reyranella sp. TaxID=1929291 RepID=UPI003D10F842